MNTVRALIRRLAAKQEQFKRWEMGNNPENMRMLETDTTLNEKFKTNLGLAKAEAGLVPSEIYVSFFKDNTLSVSLGATLLSLQVTFSPPRNIPERSRVAKALKQPFVYERLFMAEYNRCCEEHNRYLEEIKSARNVEYLSRGELLRALGHVMERASDAARMKAAFQRGKVSRQKLAQAGSESDNMQNLLRRLQSFVYRR